jgi:hypothetical protein
MDSDNNKGIEGDYEFIVILVPEYMQCFVIKDIVASFVLFYSCMVPVNIEALTTM